MILFAKNGKPVQWLAICASTYPAFFLMLSCLGRNFMVMYGSGQQKVIAGMDYAVEYVKRSRPSLGSQGIFAETRNMLLAIHDFGVGIRPDDRADCRAGCLQVFVGGKGRAKYCRATA